MCECEYVCMKEVKYARVCVGVCVSGRVCLLMIQETCLKNEEYHGVPCLDGYFKMGHRK